MPQGTWRWLAGDEGTFEIDVTGKRRRHILKFAAASLADVRRLDLTVDGRRVFSAPVPANKAQDFRLPVVLGPGSHVVGIRVRPGARRIDEVMAGTQDQRTVSIRVRAPTLEREPRPPTAFASADYGYGFATPMPSDPAGWRWLTGRDATLEMVATGPRRPLRLSFRAQSFSDRTRKLTLRLGGRVLASRRVPPDRAVRFDVALPPRATGYDLDLLTAPGASFVGPPDPRRVAIRISAPTGAGPPPRTRSDPAPLGRRRGSCDLRRVRALADVAAGA